MRHKELLETLQNLIGVKPSAKMLVDILGFSSEKVVYTRAQRNSNYSDDEIALIEKHYGIDLMGDNCVEVEHIHINPSCGNGTVVFDNAEVTSVKLGRELVKSILKISNPQNLKIFTACGDSMESIIEDKDTLLVDTGRTDYNNGGIFVLTINNEWYVKRLRLRVTGELDIISDNDKYPIETIRPDSGLEIAIKGRVIKNLSRGL